MADKLNGLGDAAQRLGVSEFTVRRRVKEGVIRSVRLGRRLLISESEVERVIREGCAPVVAGAQRANRS
jgi:excisionase family DNA binding protein